MGYWSELRAWLLKDPAKLIRYLVLFVCCIIVIVQLYECFSKLDDPPISTHSYYSLNQTIEMPAVTICRDPPYKEDELTFHWPKKAILQLIEMYKTHECLYDFKHEFYHNKHARYSALKAMTEKLKKFYPYIEVSDVKNKVIYLRGKYTREVAKIREMKAQQGTDEEYIPSAYWYDSISFLSDFIIPRKGGGDFFEQHSQVEDSRDSSQHFEIGLSTAETSKRPRMSYNTPPSSQSFASNNKPLYERDEAFSNYIKTELNEITDINIKDQLIETITLAIFEAKKQQKIANTNEANFSNFDINFID